MTEDQIRRQKKRDDKGRYSKYPACEYCGKTVNGQYYSDIRSYTGYGLVLHARCARKVRKETENMTLEEYIQFFKGLELKN
jgi:hypothetical protein